MIYPRHVYQSPGPYQNASMAPSWGCKTVNDETEHKLAIAQGWHDTRQQAIDAAGESAYITKKRKTKTSKQLKKQHKTAEKRQNQPCPAPVESVDDAAPPTRSEMEAKAIELGVKFDGRTSDKRLMERIEATLRG